MTPLPSSKSSERGGSVAEPGGSGISEPPAPPAFFPDLISSVTDGQYRPAPGSAGDVLLEAHPSSDRYTAGRSLAIFAKVALRREGLWWLMVLEAHEKYLSDHESDYLAACWREWCAGRNPFTGGRRVSA